MNPFFISGTAGHIAGVLPRRTSRSSPPPPWERCLGERVAMFASVEFHVISAPAAYRVGCAVFIPTSDLFHKAFYTKIVHSL